MTLAGNRRVLLVGSNILGNATASRRFREIIESIPGAEITCININQSDIDSSGLPNFLRRYQLIPTYLLLRRRLRFLAGCNVDFDLIFVTTCQPLTAVRNLWPKALVALWYDGLPRHPGRDLKSRLMNTLAHLLYQQAFSRVQYLLPMSNWAKQQALSFKFPALKRTILSPTRVARAVWENEHPRRAVAEEVINVLLVGNNANGKGFIDFFQWCKTECKDLASFHFTIVSSEGSARLKQVTRGMPVFIAEDVDHRDLRRLVSIYHNSHVFLLPTKADMMPNVLIEAAASQIPCIASKLGAIDEVVLHDRTGWLVESQNWEQFYERLRQFASQPDYFDDETLRQNAERYFDEKTREDLTAIIFN